MMLRGRGSNGWADALARAEAMGLPAFEGLLAALVAKALTRQPNLTENQIRDRLLNLTSSSILTIALAGEGLSAGQAGQYPEKGLARIGVAVANLKEVGLWPW